MSTKTPVKREPAATGKSAGTLTPFEEMERMFDEFFSRNWLRPFVFERPRWSEALAPFEGKTPKANIIERDDEIIINAELPGVNKDDLNITVTENTITIRGTTKKEISEEKGEYHRREISSGTYSRTLTLPANVDGTRARSVFRDGVLEVTLPKQQKSVRHQIKVD